MHGLSPAEPLTVFISGRLQEMAAERLAAGAVVAAMRLRPVLFEHTSPTASERPVFLEAARSCDIFVGLYGNEYGDALDGRPSPIEQEYLETLDSPLMPRLLFLRRTHGRQRKLQSFLDRAAAQATLSSFTTHDDLAARIKQFLSMLLADSFHALHALAEHPFAATDGAAFPLAGE